MAVVEPLAWYVDAKQSYIEAVAHCAECATTQGSAQNEGSSVLIAALDEARQNYFDALKTVGWPAPPA